MTEQEIKKKISTRQGNREIPEKKKKSVFGSICSSGVLRERARLRPDSCWDLGPPLLCALLQTGIPGDVSKVTPTHLPLPLPGEFRRRAAEKKLLYQRAGGTLTRLFRT